MRAASSIWCSPAQGGATLDKAALGKARHRQPRRGKARSGGPQGRIPKRGRQQGALFDCSQPATQNLDEDERQLHSINVPGRAANDPSSSRAGRLGGLIVFGDVLRQGPAPTRASGLLWGSDSAHLIQTSLRRRRRGAMLCVPVKRLCTEFSCSIGKVRWPLPYVQGETLKGSGGDSVRFLNHRALECESLQKEHRACLTTPPISTFPYAASMKFCACAPGASHRPQAISRAS